jgi:hypothetical protein
LANARQDEAWVTGTRRHIGYGIVVLVAIVIAVLVAVVGRTITTRAITMEYAQLGSRSGDYAGFDVQFTNMGATEIQNPQSRVEVDVHADEWACQGYIDPDSGEAIVGTDPARRPLVIPAGGSQEVTILCLIPDLPMGNAKLLFR